MNRARRVCAAGMAAVLCAVTLARADDWPQFRGLNRDGVWHEAGILQSFPQSGLEVRWRVPVGGGFSSPVVARGRVYVTDSHFDSELKKPETWERVQCVDEKSGQVLWTHKYQVTYYDWAFNPKTPNGPGSTPIVKDRKVFTLGAAGNLFCLDAASGAVVWARNTSEISGLKELSGTTASPVIEGNLLILAVGGKPGASVVAFDRDSGKEVWRALSDQWTYSSPVVITAGGRRQLIVWTREAVTSLDPATGETWWRHPMTTPYAIAAPVVRGDRLLIDGLMLRLDQTKPAASVLWPDPPVPSRRTLSETSVPLLQDGHVYSHKSHGRLICLDANTGAQLWETDRVTDHGNGACIHLTPNGDSVLLFTNQGNLIRARLTPQGYEELSRVHVIDPSFTFGGRELIWPPPAYANRHLFVRNDRELICASLEAP